MYRWKPSRPRFEPVVFTRRGFLGVLFSALLTLSLFDFCAATPQKLKQVKLTEKHIQGFMAAVATILRSSTMAPTRKNGIERSTTTRRPQRSPKKNGFAGLIPQLPQRVLRPGCVAIN